jgi:hypothetical protein
MDMEDFMWASRIFYSRDEASLVYDYKNDLFLTNNDFARGHIVRLSKLEKEAGRGGRRTVFGSMEFKRGYSESVLEVAVDNTHALSHYNRCVRIRRPSVADKTLGIKRASVNSEFLVYQISKANFNSLLRNVAQRVLNRIVEVRPLLLKRIQGFEKKEKLKLERNRTPLHKRDVLVEDEWGLDTGFSDSLVWNNTNFFSTEPEYILFYLLQCPNDRNVKSFLGRQGHKGVGRGLWMEGDYNSPHLFIDIEEDNKKVLVNIGLYYDYYLSFDRDVRVVTMVLNTVMLREFGDKEPRLDFADSKEGKSKTFLASSGDVWCL